MEEDMKPQLLIESMSFEPQLVESASGGGKKFKVKGQFALAGVPTSNGRLYKESLWRREIGRLQQAMNERKLYGELDHPEDGKTKLQRATHLITGLRVEGREIVGEAEILPTPMGKVLEALISAGAAVGVSSRGYGSTKKNEDGADVVGEDFRLLSFDFVADPAQRTAYPEIFSEAEEIASRSDEEIVESIGTDLAESIQSSANSVLTESSVALDEDEAGFRARIKAELAEQLVVSMAGMREQIAEEIRDEMMSDPAVAEAKRVVESIARSVRPYLLSEDQESYVRELEQKIESLNEQLDLTVREAKSAKSDLSEAIELGRRAALKAKAIEVFAGLENAKILVGLMEDRMRFSTDAEEVMGLARELAEEFGRRPNPDQSVVEQLESERTARELAEGRLEMIRGRMGELESRVEASESRENEMTSLLREAAEKLRGMERDEGEANSRVRSLERELEESSELLESAHEQIADLRSKYETVRSAARRSMGSRVVRMVESGASEAEIDKVLAEDAKAGQSVTDLDEMRRRVRKGMSVRASESEVFTESDNQGHKPQQAVPGVELAVHEFNALAGI